MGGTQLREKQNEEREAAAGVERAEAALQDANPEAEQARLRGELESVSSAISRLREVRVC